MVMLEDTIQVCFFYTIQDLYTIITAKWASILKNFQIKYGFGVVRLNQGVGDKQFCSRGIQGPAHTSCFI